MVHKPGFQLELLPDGTTELTTPSGEHLVNRPRCPSAPPRPVLSRDVSFDDSRREAARPVLDHAAGDAHPRRDLRQVVGGEPAGLGDLALLEHQLAAEVAGA